ncbi:EamA family transporter [Rhodospirillum rubrum]|uniref:EamA family transporter n=1 Tax=Rhodospirillum rubrum TaxID=1085 RepID=UPI001905B96A|nr:EamA family transporter [Rhodospirillum rubrum]MBK1664215.1 EamA family transporter [Rhodospirillum rubrum]MBK1676441.1 EamA family transporter [Rhodospirillum rubrum]
MDPLVFALVLGAAAMHAGWNAVVKVGLDGFSAVMLISMAAGGLSLLGLPFVPFPEPASWPFLALSGCLHMGYNVALIGAYRAGDFGQIYPIARGAAPLMVAVLSALLLDEPPGLVAALGIALLVGGVWLMSVRGGAVGRSGGLPERRALLAALMTSCFIAAYTLSDGLGGRAAGSAHAYALWLFALDGGLALLVTLVLRGRAIFKGMARALPAGIGGGALSLGAYWTVIWAMSVAPMGQVAALRESSVLFALLISVVFLGEKASRWRLGAAALIACGAGVIRLA